MSDTDSFIEEVTDEVRRDRLFALMRKYGWIGIVAVLLIVGGASWNEYTKAKRQAAAQALGDAVVSALETDDASGRADALAAIDTDMPGGAAVIEFMRASALLEAGQVGPAIDALDTIAVNGEIPQIYRDIAAFKALTLKSESAAPEELRTGFEALALPGNQMRLLAEEQLALLDMRDGNAQAAIDRLQAIIDDAEVSAGLQQRAAQVIVALGGEPQLRDAGQQG